jgi:hypothetical protein
VAERHSTAAKRREKMYVGQLQLTTLSIPLLSAGCYLMEILRETPWKIAENKTTKERLASLSPEQMQQHVANVRQFIESLISIGQIKVAQTVEMTGFALSGFKGAFQEARLDPDAEIEGVGEGEGALEEPQMGLEATNQNQSVKS